jgi:cytochrome c553
MPIGLRRIGLPLLAGMGIGVGNAQTPLPIPTTTQTTTQAPAQMSNQTPAQALLPVCGACHGADGNSAIPGTPSLAGQPRVFMENQLVLIREGLRIVPAMKGLLARTRDEDLVTLAKIYAELPAKPAPGQSESGPIDADKIKRGATLSKAGLCATCHSADYTGREQMPRLAMQREDFLRASLKEFRDGPAAGRDTIMAATLRGMSDQQLNDLAHYFATAGRHPK